MLTAVGLALLAAVLFGVGTAVQAHATTSPTRGRPPDGGRLSGLVTNPLWLTGTALDWLGALTHVVALHFGPLALVQPLALSAIVAATWTAAVLERRPLGRARLRGALETALGLALVAVCLGHSLHPGARSVRASALGVASAGLAILLPVLVARRSRRPALQAVLLGAAAGASCGLSAALVRAVQVGPVVHVLDPLRLLGTLAALATGGLGLLLTQAAFARGRVTDSLPAQDLCALVVSIGAGAALAGEVPGLGPGTLTAAGLALVAVAHGSRSLAQVSGRPKASDMEAAAAA